MSLLENIELRTDPAAATYVKNEVVQVRFAMQAGALTSSVGLNHYQVGDALITGSNGDTWCVSRDRFDPKYRPEGSHAHGQDGAYRNQPQPILAKQIAHAFSVARCAGGDVLQGAAGDWLMQYAPGDYGIVDAKRFAAVYAQTAPQAFNPVGWFEIYVQDMARAKAFYEAVFQAPLSRINSPLEMWGFPMHKTAFGASGALVKMEGVASGHNSTIVYFGSQDCALEAARAAQFGGQICREKMAIGEYGFIALVADTEGNMFGLHSMQ